MKKAITVVTMMMLSFMACAIDYEWGFTSSKIAGTTEDTYLSDGLALLYLGSMDGETKTINGTLLASAKKDSTTFNYTGTDTSEAVLSTPQSYVMVLLSSAGTVADTIAAFENGNYDGYYIVSAGKTSVVSSTPVVGSGDTPSTYSIAQFLDNTAFLSTDWSSANGVKVVPEPTSGLLMLLGIAALGLKRKRV